jgi:hypothetical protein
VCPKSKDKYLYKGNKKRGRGHLREAEIRVMEPQGMPGKLEETRNYAPPTNFGGSIVLWTPSVWTFGLQICVRMHFCSFKLPSLWQSVIVATGN